MNDKIDKLDNDESYFVYILECNTIKDGKPIIIYYTGQTNNIRRRFREHKKMHSIYTKRFNGNIRIAYIERIYGDEEKVLTVAYWREKEIKSWSRKKKERIIEENKNQTRELCNSYLIPQ